MQNEIKLVQSPIISHSLQEVGKEVSKRIEELELDKQVATVETVKSLKELRAELNKELTDFEAQRKFIKESVNNPYNEFESVYKVEISERYKSAIETLKDKIDFVESKIKTEKKQSIEAYFNELCIAESIDFITFDRVGIDINLSTTEKKYKEQIFEFISKVNDDLNLIKASDFQAETLTEYKLSLNVSSAITSVKNRKQMEAIETEKIKAITTQNRKNRLLELGLTFLVITDAYEFNADIYITRNDIENLTEQDFIKKVAEVEVKLNDLKAKQSQNIPPIQGSNSKNISQPISAPKEITEPEPLKKASFEVTATMTQLRALGEYMKQNNINYKNI